MASEEVWRKLLSAERLGRESGAGYADAARGAFDRDYDRIVFSSAFRRLQDKTQVFPLSDNDFTRTRLTHSIEVASVGRSLGRMLLQLLDEKGLLDESLDIGSIIASACLAHDIGNPPFGHSGEAAIQSWAEFNVLDSAARVSVDTPQQVRDLHEFEGNAQGIRVVSRLQSGRRRGGMQLTLATVGAMMKYPCGSVVGCHGRDLTRVDQKKFGYFVDDSELVSEALGKLGLKTVGHGAFMRHPLSFLVEAADDICYAVADLEDSVDQRLISADEAIEALVPIAGRVSRFRDKYSGRDRLSRLRAYAIHSMIEECVSIFRSSFEEIEAGEFLKSLIDGSEIRHEYKKLTDLVGATAYRDHRVLEVEAAGFRIIGGLLDIFAPALLNPSGKAESKVLELIPASYMPTPLEELSTYQRVLIATDYVSGMTDGFAVDLYQKLTGIRMPD